MDDEKELQDSPKPDEAEVDDSGQKDIEGEAKSDEKDEDSKVVPKKKYDEVEIRAKRAEQRIEKLKAQFDNKESEDKPERPRRIDSNLTAREIFELKKEHNLSDEDIFTLEDLSEENKIPIDNLVKNKIIMAGLEKTRESAKVEQATPSSPNRTAKSFDSKKWDEVVKSGDKKAMKEFWDKNYS